MKNTENETTILRLQLYNRFLKSAIVKRYPLSEEMIRELDMEFRESEIDLLKRKVEKFECTAFHNFDCPECGFSGILPIRTDTDGKYVKCPFCGTDNSV